MTAKHLRGAKGLAVVALLASVAMPQSTCAGYRAPDGRFVASIPNGAKASDYQPTVQRRYAFDNAHLDDPQTWIRVGAFVWPLPLLAISLGRSARLRAYGMVLEPVLALGAGVVIWSDAAVFATPAVGAYVALAALLIHLGASSVTLWQGWRTARSDTGREEVPS